MPRALDRLGLAMHTNYSPNCTRLRNDLCVGLDAKRQGLTLVRRSTACSFIRHDTVAQRLWVSLVSPKIQVGCVRPPQSVDIPCDL